MRATDGRPRSWRGYSFRGDAKGAFFNVSLGVKESARSFEVSLPPNEVQWWYEL